MTNVKGVAPGFLLLPAREYEWEIIKKVELRTPVSGSIAALLTKEDSATGTTIPGEDEFTIFDDNLLLLWELVRVLFAESSYPALENDEAFNAVAIEFEGDEVVVHGEIIKYVG